MWTLVRKELLASLLTVRLGVALIFTVVLAVLTTLIGSVDYSRSVAEYERELRDRQQAQEEVTVYRNLEPRILVPPLPLSVFSRGLVQTSAQEVGIGIDWVPVGAWRLGSFDNRLMNVLTQIDFTGVVAILLSFLAVVLGFDAICGERERGTLGLVLTNPVSRATVVAAKLIGGVVCLWVPFTLAFGICLLIALANPDLALNAEDGVRLALLFALSCLFLAQVFAFSLMVSSLTRDSSTSLIVCLFAWLVGGIGYVSLLPSVSRFGVDEPAADVYRDQNRQLWQEFNRQMEAWEANHPPPAQPYMEVFGWNQVMRYGHPVGYAWRERRLAVEMDKRLERADRSHTLQWANWGPLAREASQVDEWAILSPFTNYQVLCYYLAHTTLDDSFYLASLARDYRQTWLSWMRGRGALSTRRWFTDDPADQEPMVADPASVTEAMLSPDAPFMQQRMAWAEQQQRRAAQDASRRLDLSDMPKFTSQWKRTLPQSLAVMMPGLLVLILSSGLALSLAVVRFLRYDPR